MPPEANTIQLIEPESDLDFDRYYKLRWRLLRAPWNQPPGSEKDDLDSISTHLMACASDRIPLGVGRFHFSESDTAWIRYMAVNPIDRNKGIGSLLLSELERIAISQGATSINLHAREPALSFYVHAGYIKVAPSHVLYGVIAHTQMRKPIQLKQ